MQVIRHIKLNQANRPCHSSLEYDYGQCLYQSATEMAGCQPYWKPFPLERIPTCSNYSIIKEYQNIMANIAYNSDREDIRQKTKCVIPCTFYEYKVSF